MLVIKASPEFLRVIANSSNMQCFNALTVKTASKYVLIKKNQPFWSKLMNLLVWLSWHKGAAPNQFWKISFLALKHHSVEKKVFFMTRRSIF